MPKNKSIKQKLVEILESIEMTFDDERKVAIFWIDEKKITPTELATQLLQLFSEELPEERTAIDFCKNPSIEEDYVALGWNSYCEVLRQKLE